MFIFRIFHFKDTYGKSPTSAKSVKNSPASCSVIAGRPSISCHVSIGFPVLHEYFCKLRRCDVFYAFLEDVQVRRNLTLQLLAWQQTVGHTQDGRFPDTFLETL